MRKSSILVLFSLVLAGQVMAMDPDPMLKQLEPFARQYDCRGIAYATPMAPEHATHATVNGEWILGGNWVRFSYSEKKTAENPMPFVVNGYFGYDLETKQLVVGTVDNMAGYSTAAAAGWNGDTLVFSGPWHMASKTFNARDTFMKKDNGQIMHVGELEMDGKWMKLSQETCMPAKK